MLKLRPLLEQLTIKTKKAELRPYNLDYVDPDEGDLGWAARPFVQEIERQYNQNKPVRVIVLKARQLGISTATEACLFWWCFLHPGSNTLVLSHEDSQAQELFAMTKLYWDSWPHRALYTQRYATRRQISWRETLSQIRVATAKNEEAGRGSTLQALHASEVAYWPNPEALWSNLDQSVSQHPKSLVVLESTANGVGNWFYDMWQRAEEGSIDYVPMFFPWYKHPEYHHNQYHKSTRIELDPDEKRLQTLMEKDGFNDEYIYGSISWRNWKILNSYNGDIDRFMEGYPSYPEEAFITSGKPIFPWRQLYSCFEEQRGLRGYCHRDPTGRVRFVADPSGNLIIYKRPSRDQDPTRYFVAGDPSESIGGDPACIQVISRGTLEQVAVWHGRTDPVNFGDEMMLLGDLYNHCMLCPEAEGGGQATVARIISVGYNSIWTHKTADRIRGSFNVYGWSTNYQRKYWCIGFLKRLIMDGSIILHDRHTYNQLRNYVQHPNGEWGNGDGTHDDAVMALAIAVTASDKEGVYMPESTRGSQTILDIYNQEYSDDQADIYEMR